MTHQPIRVPESVRRLLDEAGRVVPASAAERERTWRRLERTLGPRRRRRGPLLFAFDLTALALVVIMAMTMRHAAMSVPSRSLAPTLAAASSVIAPPAPATITLAGGATVMVSPGARLRVVRASTSELALALEGGRATVRTPAAVSAPSISIVTGAFRVAGFARRFDVDVTMTVTTVHVEDGALQLQSDDAIVPVAAGRTARSDDARLAPRRAVAMPNVAGDATAVADATANARPGAPARARTTAPSRADRFEACASTADPTAARACYIALTDGDDLIAADALFALGTLAAGPLHRAAEARDFFAAYLTRSPAGPLAPEAALGAIDAAVTLHDRADARARIAAFIARHPTHPAAPRLRRLAATLP